MNLNFKVMDLECIDFKSINIKISCLDVFYAYNGLKL